MRGIGANGARYLTGVRERLCIGARDGKRAGTAAANGGPHGPNIPGPSKYLLLRCNALFGLRGKLTRAG